MIQPYSAEDEWIRVEVVTRKLRGAAVAMVALMETVRPGS
jgi:hypothetical protein